METPKLLRRPAVEAMTGLSRAAIYAHMREGTFPRPIALGPKTVGWLESEVVNWVNLKVKQSRGKRNG